MHPKRLDDVALLSLYSVKDSARGTLCVAEYDKHIPFEIKRVFYFYDLPHGITRGEHAHRKQDQFLICLSGKVELSTVNKHGKRDFHLHRPNEGVYFPSMTWIDIKVVETPAICLVMASDFYDESDYIRDRAEFNALCKGT